MASHESDHNTCTDCGVKITGVPVVPSQAQIEKLKPTVLCAGCAEDRGLTFDTHVFGGPGD